MGTLTLDQLKVEVRAGLGNRTDLDPRLTRFLNLAQQRLARLHDFDEMEKISLSEFPFTNKASDKYMSMPGIREVYSFKYIDTQGQSSRKLRQVEPRMWNTVIPAPQSYTRWKPTHYTLWANTIVLYPLASQAGLECELWWTKWPLDFNDNSPTVVSDFNQKDEILIELALVYAYNSLAKLDDAQVHWQRAMPLIAEALHTDMEKPDLDIRPGPSLNDAVQLPGEYWNDPFTKSIGN